MTGCWGGVLAAAACPHTECEMTASAPSDTAGAGVHDHDAVTSEDHSGHTAEHGGHAAEPPAQGRSGVSPAGVLNVGPGRHDPGCTHCLGRPEAPPSPNFEVQANSASKGGESTAPNAAARAGAPAAVFLREITPAQHAPPGRSDRHLLLLNVFRI